MRIAIFASLLCWAIAATAGPILGPVAASGSSVDPFGRLPGNAIDQSGLSANYVSGVTDFDTFVATTTATFGSITVDLAGIGAPPGYFQFDLGSVMSIDAAAIWPQNGSASLDTFTLEFSQLSDFSVSQLTGVLTMSIFGGTSPAAADVFSFGPVDARYVRVNALTNAGFGSATVINEIAFRQAMTTPMPEPTSLALCTLGIAALVRRRRR